MKLNWYIVLGIPAIFIAYRIGMIRGIVMMRNKYLQMRVERSSSFLEMADKAFKTEMEGDDLYRGR